MCLVENDHRILLDIRIHETFTLQHTVGHVLDPRFGTRAILETYGVANFLTKAAAYFFSDALRNGHRCDTTRLGAAYHSMISEAFLGQILSHLGCLARTGIAYDNEDLVLERVSAKKT